MAPNTSGEGGGKTNTPSPKTVVSDILTHVSNVLPTGTFLVFQVLAPLATNNGNCHKTEKVVTSVTLAILSLLCFFTCYTDSFKAAENGILYFGVVTCKGLWNPNFKHVNLLCIVKGFHPDTKFRPQLDDLLNGIVSVVTLLTISLLTEPVTTCFYPNIPASVEKTVPLLVGLVVSILCAFGSNSRHGIGFGPPSPHEGEDDSQPAEDSTAKPATRSGGAAAGTTPSVDDKMSHHV